MSGKKTDHPLHVSIQTGILSLANDGTPLPLKSTFSTDYELHLGSALSLLKRIPTASIHLIATDPPYFIDGMGADWDHDKLNTKAKKAGVIGTLPVGMQFNPEQGRQFEKFMNDIASESFRVLKPGGFFVSFSQARLYHRMAVAVENAGFEVRDMMAWKYEGQAKAFSMDHFIRKMDISDEEKTKILASIAGRKTPQLKPQMEPMVLAQKPKEGTFVQNWMANQTGLIDVSASLDGKFPGNIMEVRKPSKEEKGHGSLHLTVKPLSLMEHLIRLLSIEGQIVLDPFSGSGTTGVAANRLKRRYIGFEIEERYFDASIKRLNGEPWNEPENKENIKNTSTDIPE